MDNFALSPIAEEERGEFEMMAIAHYRELNPQFEPHDDWRANYFTTIFTNAQMFLRWIVSGESHLGFVIYGIEKHRFLPRHYGMIYELYVKPEYRSQGIGFQAGELAINDLRKHDISRIQLEVIAGNDKAARLWEKMGFQPVSMRYVLA
jgi:ribosomal protein S18 acetylase RimI-like enzyme